MAGLGDITSALGGIGEAINGGVSGYIEAKKEKRITDRQDELWNEQQNAKLSDTVTSANNIRQYVDPTIDPWAQAHAAATAAQTHAAQFTGGGAAPATPSPAAPVSKPSVVPPLAQSLGLAPTPAASQASPLAPGYLQQQLAARQGQGQAPRQTTMDVDPSLISKGLLEPGNIPLKDRPLIDMPGGQVGSEFSTSFNQNGKEVLVPTIFDGKQHSPKEAWAHYLKTGQHLGKYDNAEDADRAAEIIHQREYAPGGSLDQSAHQGSPSQGQQPSQAPPQWTGDTDDPVANQNHARYEAFRQKVERDAASIHDAANGDSKKEDQMLAAYSRNHKSEFDDQQKALDTYLSNANQNYQRQRMAAGMEKWFSDEGLGNTFGQGARKEGNTLVLPDGKTRMILQTPLIWAAYKQGIATEKEVMDAWGKDTKNAEDLMSKSKETAVEIEKMREQNRLQLAQLRAQRDPKADMAQRVYALHRHMGEDDATATRAEASFIEHGDKTDLDKLKEDDMEQTRAGKRVDSVMKQFADIDGGYDEKKMTPSRTLAIYNSMIKTDKPGAAALYLRLPDPNRAAIDAQNAQDAGANRPGSGQSPTAKPSQVKSPSPKPSAPANVNIAQERQNAAAAIKQRPDIADRVKSEYKKRTGKDY
jgi:hypothetical protein